MRCHVRVAVLFVASFVGIGHADEPKVDTSRGDEMLANYFAIETQKLSAACMADIQTLDDWQARRPEYHRQLLEMLGLDPLPEKTPLQPTVTGKLEHDEFTVEKLHFQSRPGLYVTGNLYVPRGLKGPVPAVLYVCGHSRVVKDGVAYGAKANYQHHGIWFARHGFVCLTIDTLQLGEIEGIHHGTHRYGRWWWLCRGYVPTGVEAWNCVRALDYLETRPEVDKSRLGVTGRSGGGSYSWWISAIDDRIQSSVPVAGIVDLENHVVDGVVEGHCDCMYMLNTYRWDYPQVAAMVAPRPLLLTNTDKDNIFPLEGVERVHQHTRYIYQLHQANNNFGLQISEGPHKDIPELQVAAFRWMNRFLKREDPPIEHAAVKLFEPEQLKVFATLPTDEINTKIDETFVAQEQPAVPKNAAGWAAMRDRWITLLREKVFRGWPDDAGAVHVTPVFAAERDGMSLSAYDFNSQDAVDLRLYFWQKSEGERKERVEVIVLDDTGWNEFLAAMRAGFAKELTGEAQPPADEKAYQRFQEGVSSPRCAVFFAPRGVGPTAFDATEKKQVQNRRRFMLLGQTLDGMQVWDVRRAVQAIRTIPEFRNVPLTLSGQKQAAGLALYASLFEPEINKLHLTDLPKSHREGPIFFNVLRWFDLPQALAMAAERSQVEILGNADDWKYATATAQALGWDSKQLEISPNGAK